VKYIYRRCPVDVKVGDIYIRNSNEEVYRVKNIDNKMVVLEAEDGSHLILINIFGLENGYRKTEPKST
jgi:hypothetical protein